MFVDYQDRKIYLEIRGEGRPVMLVHGLGGSTRYWQQTMAVLCNSGFKVIAMDLPGFGRSDLPSNRMNVGDYVSVIVHIATSLNLKSFSMVGCSMGGLISWLTAATHPELVERVVLVSPVGAPSRIDATIPSPGYLRMPGLGLVIKVAAKAAIDRAIAYPLIARTFGNPSCVTREVFDVMRTSAREMRVLHKGLLVWHGPGNPDFWMNKIKSPTLIVWGEKDRILPKNALAFYQRYIPHARVIMYKNCGHVPMLEIPSVFNEDIVLFLSGETDPIT